LDQNLVSPSGKKWAMVGLVNAAGTPETSRVQSVFTAALQAGETKGGLLPIVNSQQAAERVLRSAVDTIEFTNGDVVRPTPDGGQSDRFAQAELEAATTESVGKFLDVTA